MKKTIILLIISAVLPATLLRAQDYSITFGYPTMYELEMEYFPEDPEAKAVMIYETNDIKFTGSGLVHQLWDYAAKIKIFDKSALRRAIIEIPYYSPERNVGEKIMNVEALCHNLVNGKIVTTKLDRKKQVLTEKMDIPGMYVMRFGIPDAVPGSVIEYRWTIKSFNTDEISPVIMQHDIPVVHSINSAVYPEDLPVVSVLTDRAMPYAQSPNHQMGYRDRVNVAPGISFNGSYIPAFRNEPYVWCPEEMRSRMEFKLMSDFAVYNPGYYGYGEFIGRSNPDWYNFSYFIISYLNYPLLQRVSKEKKDELDSDEHPYDTLRRIHKMVTSEVSWNGEYRMWPGNWSADIPGNSADINYLLMYRLSQAGFDVEPVIVNTRGFGALPEKYPRPEDLQTYIVMVNMPDGRKVFLDGTDPYSDINMFNEELMTDNARQLSKNPAGQILDLTKMADHNVRVKVKGAVDRNGKFEGEIEAVLDNMPAYNEYRKYRESIADGVYAGELGIRMGASVSDFTLAADTTTVVQKYRFSRQLDVDGEGNIALPATVIPIFEGNPLTTSRVFPIQFSYPVNVNFTTEVTLPEGYRAVAKDDTVSFSYLDESVLFACDVMNMGDKLRVDHEFTLTRIHFYPEENFALYSLLGSIIDEMEKNIVISPVGAK